MALNLERRAAESQFRGWISAAALSSRLFVVPRSRRLSTSANRTKEYRFHSHRRSVENGEKDATAVPSLSASGELLRAGVRDVDGRSGADSSLCARSARARCWSAGEIGMD